MKLKWLIALIVGVVAIAGLIWVGLNEQSAEANRLAKLQNEARQRHLPTTAEALAARMPRCAEADNAWPIYRRAILALRPDALGGDPQPNPFGIEPQAVEELIAAAREWRRNQFESTFDGAHRATLQAVQPVFETLREAGKRPSMEIPGDLSKGMWQNVPELVELGRLARLCIVDAVIAAEAGDRSRFAERMRILADLIRHLASVPLHTYGNYAWSLASNGQDVLQQQLARGQWGFEALPLFRELAGRLEVKIDPAALFRADIGVFLVSIDVLSSREKIRAAGIQDRFALRTVPKPEAVAEAQRALLEHSLAILRRWPSKPEDTTAMREAVGSDDGEIFKTLSSFSSQFRYLQGNPDEPLVGPMGRILIAYQSYVARFRLNRCFFALLERRGSNGAFPSALDASLGTDAVDPFSGKPLRYSLRPGGFVLYSIGQNMKDDGGVDVRDNGRPLDIVIRFPGGGSSL